MTRDGRGRYPQLCCPKPRPCRRRAAGAGPCRRRRGARGEEAAAGERDQRASPSDADPPQADAAAPSGVSRRNATVNVERSEPDYPPRKRPDSGRKDAWMGAARRVAQRAARERVSPWTGSIESSMPRARSCARRPGGYPREAGGSRARDRSSPTHEEASHRTTDQAAIAADVGDEMARARRRVV